MVRRTWPRTGAGQVDRDRADVPGSARIDLLMEALNGGVVVAVAFEQVVAAADAAAVGASCGPVRLVRCEVEPARYATYDVVRSGTSVGRCRVRFEADPGGGARVDFVVGEYEVTPTLAGGLRGGRERSTARRPLRRFARALRRELGILDQVA